MVQRVKSSNGGDSEVPLTRKLNGNEQCNDGSSPDNSPKIPAEQASYVTPQASQTTLAMQVALPFFLLYSFLFLEPCLW